ncbi:SOS response-associated peptidase family protein [Cupriavidus basilensis]
MFWKKRQDGGWLRIPKAMRADFAAPDNEQEHEIAVLIAEGDREQANVLEARLFEQRTRLAAAERALAARPTKAENDRRIATAKIGQFQSSLADLQRTGLVDRDFRIFPGHYAPVMIERDGQRLLVPMRYQCRLPGWTEADEKNKPGTYNARRNNLENAWRKLFGRQHGVMVATSFFENVPRHRVEQRELGPGEPLENTVLEFRPQPPQDMLVACLWSFTKGTDEEGDLFSFAAITDEPPPEVAAAGHDRCIIPIREENLDAWLNPDPNDLGALYAILDNRAPAYFEHRLAA